MPRTRPAYPVEFREEMVRLVRAGRTPGELSREFEPSEQTKSVTGCAKPTLTTGIVKG